MISLDQHASLLDLTRRMAITDVPGNTRQGGADDLKQVFGGGADGDPGAINGLDNIAICEETRIRQIYEEALASDIERASAEVTGGIVESDFGAQNRKYRCAMGKTSAGSHVSNSPSARTS